jgi:hypothetical protein
VFPLLVGCALLWASQALHAAQCTQSPSSFDDVVVSDIFCTDVQWLRNRGVTLGCTATEFCPFDVVTRASMALFMKRLAEAIVPEPMFATGQISDQTIGLPPPPPAAQFCLITIPDSPNVYPRAFSITARVSVFGAPDGHLSITVRSEAAGGMVQTIHQVNIRTTAGVESHVPILFLHKPAAAAGARTYRLGLHSIAPIHVPIADCELRIEARSMTGSAPPY